MDKTQKAIGSAFGALMSESVCILYLLSQKFKWIKNNEFKYLINFLIFNWNEIKDLCFHTIYIKSPYIPKI